MANWSYLICGPQLLFSADSLVRTKRPYEKMEKNMLNWLNSWHFNSIVLNCSSMGSEYLLHKHVLRRICSPATEPEVEIQGLGIRKDRLKTQKKQSTCLNSLNKARFFKIPLQEMYMYKIAILIFYIHIRYISMFIIVYIYMKSQLFQPNTTHRFFWWWKKTKVPHEILSKLHEFTVH